MADNCHRKAIAKAFKAMLSSVLKKEEMTRTAGHPSDYMVRWGNQLGMEAKHQKACQDLIEAIIPRPGRERTGRYSSTPLSQACLCTVIERINS